LAATTKPYLLTVRPILVKKQGLIAAMFIILK